MGVGQAKGWRCAAAAFVLYLVTGSRLHPTDVHDWFVIALHALLAGAFALAVAWIALAILTFFIQWIPKPKPGLPALPLPEPPHECQEANDHPIPPAPPPPTTEERAAEALKRYESKLQLIANARLDEVELKAARERAKQQYLRDLDEAMK